MNASAYLRNQGWRGDGHSLDHTDRGIKKPLLVSKKVDVLGLGLNKHAAVSDQWWLRAFDQGLKNLGTGQESVLGSVRKHGINRGGLYGRFVKGEGFAGSIGQSLQGSENTTGSNTPTDTQQDSDIKMGIDIPPEDKLERVVGVHESQESHDAMMHLLQNPKDAPASMRKMLDKKRKRAERPVEKRARRKTERQAKHRAAAIENREQAVEDGTFDYEAEEEKQRMREINRRAKEFVLEAQKRGIIPLGPNEIRKGIKVTPTGGNAESVAGDGNGNPADQFTQVFDQAGLNTQVKFKGSGKQSLKAQKYAREKMKRELKRAAKAYLLGEKPPHEMTKEERKAKRDKKKEGSAQRKADAAKKDAERMATREERAAKKRAFRIKRRAEKEEVTRIMEERQAAAKAGKTMEEYYAERASREAANVSEETESNDDVSDSDGDNSDTSESTDADESSEDDESVSDEEGIDEESGNNSSNGVKQAASNGVKKPTSSGTTTGNEFDHGADEVKFGMTTKGGYKKIPGVGHVDRYPTKAEKKAKKIMALSIKNGITEEEVKAGFVAKNEEKVAAEREKIDRYRAMKNGMSLEQYKDSLAKGEVYIPKVQRKNIPPKKLAEYQKRAEEKGIKLDEYIKRREEKTASKQAVKLGNPFQQDMHAATNGGADFIVAEPEQAPIKTSNANASSNNLGFVMDTAGDDKLVNNFSQRATNAIAEGKPLAIVDTQGNETFAWQPHMPVPQDPRIWEGLDVKTLPKSVRKARRDWMAARREERKARAIQGGDKPTPKKSKGARKVEAREAFVKQVLFHSRQALRSGGVGSGMVTIDGVANVPLVKVETREGMFKKDEVALARTVARRTLRTVKREERAKNGKGKGWKKRERAAKDAARNAGISGFTDKARLEVGGNRDLLL